MRVDARRAMLLLHSADTRHAILLTTQKKKFGAQLVCARLLAFDLCCLQLPDLDP